MRDDRFSKRSPVAPVKSDEIRLRRATVPQNKLETYKATDVTVVTTFRKREKEQ